MTRAELLAIHQWNADQERARVAYDECPNAFGWLLAHNRCPRTADCAAHREQHPKEWYRW